MADVSDPAFWDAQYRTGAPPAWDLGIPAPGLLGWLAEHQPDALCLQETKLTDDKFPHEELKAAGYESQWFGQKTYNGVALLTRGPADAVVKNIPGYSDEQSRVIAGTVSGVRVIGGACR